VPSVLRHHTDVISTGEQTQKFCGLFNYFVSAIGETVVGGSRGLICYSPDICLEGPGKTAKSLL
jgi:hypothetical protein